MAAAFLHCAQSENMRLSKIDHMDIISHTGSVECWVVISKDRNAFALLHSHLENERDEVEFRCVIFTPCRGGSSCIKVAHTGKADSVNPVQPIQHALEDEFRFTVRAAWDNPLSLVDGYPFWLIKQIRGGRKNDPFNSVFDHALKQVQSGGDIVPQIQKRLRHRLTDQRLGGEVHHGIRTMLAQSSVNRCSIRQIACHKNSIRMHRRSMSQREIVEYHHRLSRCDELFDDHAADVAGSAGYEDFHEFLSLK